ncbi:hypothetical protein CN918_28840 [Priestia megaterium]|nr:hypothetical protein CN918_28840 [Priestia megaterium]
MNFSNIDSIKLSSDDYHLLFKWKDNNKETVRNFNPVLNEGVILVEDSIKQYFKQEGINIYYEVYIGDSYFFDIIFQRLEDGQNLLKEHHFNPVVLNELKYPREQAIGDAMSLHNTLMAYMEYHMENKTYITREEVKKRSGNSGTNKKKKRKDKRRVNVVKIKKKVYHVTVGKNTQPVKEPRKIKRIAEKWTVQGHWRHFKNGTKTYIKSYEKGRGAKLTPKTYELE